MKKLLALLLTLLLSLGMILPVSADILWEPYNNDYYMNDYESCDVIARNYVVPDGMTVNFYHNPETGGLIDTLEAGTRLYVGFSKKVDGEIWGVGYPIGDWESEGWFRLGRLQLEYDHEAFMEDHKDEVSGTTDFLDATQFTAPLPTWTYPGSGKIDITLDCEWEKVGFNDGKMEYRYTYTDPDGGQWGYVGYFMGHCGWIYLDDLYTETPPTFPQEMESTVTDTSDTEKDPGGALSNILPAPTDAASDIPYLWIVILVAAVVIATAICILVLKRRRK